MATCSPRMCTVSGRRVSSSACGDARAPRAPRRPDRMRGVRRTPEDLAVSISFDLPASVEDQLRREFTDLDVVAKEAVLVELYRQGRITHHQLGLSLGLERHETDGLLKSHNVTEDLPRAEELAEEIATLRRLIDG